GPETRNLWPSFSSPRCVPVFVDAGPTQALVDRGSSLLPAGVVDATGDFTAGDAVDIVGADGRRLARGLVGYNRQDLLELRGRSTRDLGAHRGRPRAVIHRDSLVLL
ncbi:MAG: PUA domain-containing protein, partial [Egibacteraceae bacterium]